jgi:hypothetical protein
MHVAFPVILKQKYTSIIPIPRIINEIEVYKAGMVNFTIEE